MGYNNFTIKNSSVQPLQIFWEPFGFLSIIKIGGSVTICEDYKDTPLTIQYLAGANGVYSISIWEGDGIVKAFYNDQDLTQLMIEGSGVFSSVE